MADGESGTVERARNQVDKVRKRIRAAVEAGRAYDAKSLARKLFLSHAVKVLACHEALASRPLRERQKLSSLETLVRRIGDRDDDQQVRIIRQSKGDGGFRDIFDFSVLDRARQNWVKLSFEPLARYHPNQSGVTGSGSIAMMDRIREAVKSGAYCFAAELDIKSCFQSIQNMEFLKAEWGLPDWAIQQIVTLKGKEDQGLIMDRKGKALTSSSSSRGTLTTRGLPQGASTSPLFAYSLNRPVLEALERDHGHEAAVFNYCDNFLVLGISRDAVERTHRTLTKLLLEQPVGPLALHIKTAPTPLGRGISFLGYRIRKKPGEPIISVDHARKVRFLREVRTKLRYAKGVPISRQALYLIDLRRYVEGWVSAYSAASNDVVEIVRALDRIFAGARERAQIGAAMRQLAKRLPSQNALDENFLAGSTSTRVRSRMCGCLANDFIQVPLSYSIRQTVRGLPTVQTDVRGASSPKRFAAANERLSGGHWVVPKSFSIKRVKLLVQEMQSGRGA